MDVIKVVVTIGVNCLARRKLWLVGLAQNWVCIDIAMGNVDIAQPASKTQIFKIGIGVIIVGCDVYSMSMDCQLY